MVIKGFFVLQYYHITIRLRLRQTIYMTFSQNTNVNIRIILLKTKNRKFHQLSISAVNDTLRHDFSTTLKNSNKATVYLFRSKIINQNSF